jgi:FixJ family two-component response regulator
VSIPGTTDNDARPARGFKTSAEMQQQVVQRYTSEQPMRQIAAELGCSYGTVHLLLTRAGTPLRPRGGARRTGSGARVTASNPHGPQRRT